MSEQEHEIMIEYAAISYLGGKNKDELLKFVFEDSAKRVKQIYNQAVFQRNDYTDSVDIAMKGMMLHFKFGDLQRKESTQIEKYKDRYEEKKKKLADLEIKIE